jgi:4-hydroxy-tetrahydrodipicolinate synthase
MKLNNVKLWTALITPMNRDGSVHYGDLEKLARIQENAGNGILLAGSTGEGLALRSEEKKRLVEFVVGLGLDVPVMAGVGGFDLEAQKEWIGYCNDTGVDAFLLVTPLYAKPGPIGQTEWFTSLLDEAGAPCMVYNIPSRTGTKLPVSTLQTISKHPEFWSVKEASGSVEEFKAYGEACPNVPLYSGDDALMPDFSKAGGSGLVSVASNVWPGPTHLYTEMCLAGNTDSLFPVWRNAIKALFSAPNPVPAKKLLSKKGVIENPTLRPPLTEKEMDSVDELLRADNEIEQWFNKNR